MRRILLIFLSFSSLLFSEEKVGVLVMAAGNDDPYATKMIESARKYFLPAKEKTFFIFTDAKIPEAKDIVRIEQKKLGWPDDLLKKFHACLAHQDLFAEMDYLFCIDADMEFVSEVGSEVLRDLVATRHWGFLYVPGTYCANKKSAAFVEKAQRKHYCTKSFYGGKRDEMLRLFSENKRAIDQDLEKKVRPKWLDEAYLNKYFVDHPPSVFLGADYNSPEGNQMTPAPKLIVHLNKSKSR